MTSIRLGLLLGLAPLSGAAPAQNPRPPAEVAGFAWNDSIGVAGAFTRSTSGRFQTPDRRDVVLLRDGTPVYLAQPGVFTSQFALDVATGYVANDVATFPGPAGGIDRLVMVGSGEACLVELGPYPTNPPSQQTFFGGSEWIGARRVAVGDFTGLGQPQIAAISADGMEILLATEASDGSFALSSFVLPVEATAILAANWSKGPDCTPTPEEEIVLATTAGLHVYDDAGQLLYSRNNVASGDDHVVLLPGHNRTCPGLVLDAVAWITPHPVHSGYHALVVVGAGLLEPTLLLSQPNLAAAVGGELLSGPDAHDLVVVYEGGFEAHILCNSGPPETAFPGASFDSDHPFIVPFFAGTPANPAALRATPTVGDFDGDGFHDVLIPVGEGNWLSYVDGPGKQEYPAGTVCGNTGLLPRALGSSYESCEGVSTPLVLQMDIPDAVEGGAVATHVEVAAYVAPCGVVDDELCPAYPIPEAAGYLEIGDITVGGVIPVPCEGGPADGHIRCDVVIEGLPAQASESADEVFYAYCRPVRIEDETLVAVGRPMIVVWAPNREVPSFYEWVDPEWEVGYETEMTVEVCPPALPPLFGDTILDPIAKGLRISFGPPPPPPPPPPASQGS